MSKRELPRRRDPAHRGPDGVNTHRLSRRASWWRRGLRRVHDLAGGRAGAFLNDLSTRASGLRVERVRLRRPTYPAGAPPLRALFLSDLHAGPVTGPRVLLQAAGALRRLRPDLVLLGGDYVYLHAGHAAELLPLLSAWSPPLGIIGIFGNHDLAAGAAAVARGLAPAGVRLLRNEAAALPPPFAGVHVVGIDDPWLGYPDAAAMDALPEDAFTILLTHSPEGIDDLGARRADLILAGHTHGGMVCLPGGRPLYMPSPRSAQFSAGLFETERGPIFVSRGVGAVYLPVRLFAPPDVVLVELSR